MTGPPSTTDLLQTLLAAEHAAVYGYAVLGARLDDARRLRAQQAASDHRALRDDLAARVRARGAAPAGPRAAYDAAVASQPSAVALAVRLEEGLALRWRDLVGGTDDASLRRLGVTGLTGTAVRAAQWRAGTGAAPPTTALPGQDTPTPDQGLGPQAD